MHHTYQQLDLQTLIDLLADETEKYTRVFISGNSKNNDQQRATINALVEEINRRKSGAGLIDGDRDNFTKTNDFPCC